VPARQVPLRPGFGPPLTAVAHRRLGVPAPVTLAAVAALVLAAGAAMAFVRTGAGEVGEPLVHRGSPVFNVLASDAMRPAEPRPGELLRLEGATRRASAVVTVRPLALPPFRGDVPHALLPVVASRHRDALRARVPGFALREEGRARVNDAPGYEVAFGGRAPGGRLVGSDVLLVPDGVTTAGAVLLSLRREVRGDARGARARQLSAAARSAFRSFRYGEDRG
jgi:hypothetical protein